MQHWHNQDLWTRKSRVAVRAKQQRDVMQQQQQQHSSDNTVDDDATGLVFTSQHCDQQVVQVMLNCTLQIHFIGNDQFIKAIITCDCLASNDNLVLLCKWWLLFCGLSCKYGSFNYNSQKIFSKLSIRQFFCSTFVETLSRNVILDILPKSFALIPEYLVL